MPRSPKAPKPVAPKPPGYAITELTMMQCRFPITPHSARFHRFCGDPTTDPKVPWCEHHQTVVFDRRTQDQMRRDNEKAAKARDAIKEDLKRKQAAHYGLVHPREAD